MASKTASTKKQYQDLVQLAVRSGASRARIISTSDIVIDERVRLKCMAPLCDNYDRHLLCPPNNLSVDEFREIAGRYRYAILLQLDASYDSMDRSSEPLSRCVRDDLEEGSRRDDSESRLHRIVNDLERASFKKGHYLAAGLIASHCTLCDQCVGGRRDERCRHPFEARPSMQSMGIDVIKTCQKAGIPVKLSSKEKVRWTGIVLIA